MFKREKGNDTDRDEEKKKYSGESQPLKTIYKMGDKSVKSKPQLKTNNQEEEVRQRITHENIDEDFMDKEIVERVYKPISRTSKAAYEILLDQIKKYYGDEQTSTIISIANEVLSILKLQGLKEENMKQQINSFMKVSDEDFRKLMSISKTITDFQSQTSENMNQKKNTGTEIRLNIGDDNENENQIETEVQEDTARKDEGDVGMKDFLVKDEVYNQVIEEEGNEQENDYLVDNEDVNESKADSKNVENKKKTKKEKIVRPNDMKAGIQSVIAGKKENDNQIIEEEDEEEVEEEIIFDRAEKYLEEKLGENINKGNNLAEFVEVLGIKDDGDCQTGIFEFISTKEEFQDLDMTLIHDIYKNRKELFFNIGLNLYKSNKTKFDNLLNVMKEDEMGKQILEQKTKNLSENEEKEDENLGKLILQSKEMKHLIEKTELLNLKMNEDKNLDNESLANLSKNTFKMKFKVKQCTPNVTNRVKLPRGTTRYNEKGYEVVKIPAETKKGDFGIKIRSIKDNLPEYVHEIFGEIQKLNKIQKDDSNVLVCAPTGAGKTIIALLSILRVLQNNNSSSDPRNPSIAFEDFKIVYIAPMKALVNEVVATLRHRLNSLGVVVSEFTGDSHLSRKEVELSQILVCTPEKWDVATRKEDNKIPEDKLSLLIIDEVHLLNDSRGPVIETLVSRLKERERNSNANSKKCRILGLSATLPNYKDVGSFLNVPERNIFYFDGSFRPVPLSLEYIGISENKRFKQMMLTKEVLYRKVIERVKHSQILIFVHSRKDCVRTANELREMAYSDDLLSLFVGELTDSKQILKSQKDNIINSDLSEIVEYGIGFHHAGLERKDRNLVEDLFADKHLAVLISTATLAWGVNLPARTVIIKNTQVYSPELGRWTELNMQDLLQMLGRAGRPFYDKEGEGIIITSMDELKMYLSLTNEQLPIESQLLVNLTEILNAEISLGNITNLESAMKWIDHTYFSLRLKSNPHFYEMKYSHDKLGFFRYKLDLIHSACVYLESYGMIRYDRTRGVFESTPEGRIASEFYIKSNTLKIFSENLTPQMNVINLLKTFAKADEFKYITIREEEISELEKLKSSVPYPVNGSLEEPTSKIIILLQCYIGNVQLEGYAIAADMIYISQNAQRLFRGMYQIALKKNLGQLTLKVLDFCKMIEQRIWSVESPLRQYMDLPEKLFQRIEQQEHITWDHLRSMTPEQLAIVIKNENISKKIHKFLELFPYLNIEVYAQPITRNQVKVQIELKKKFKWNYEVHGGSLYFWVFVLDVDEESLIFAEQVCVTSNVNSNVNMEFLLPLTDPIQPHYFIKVVSDNWLGCESSIPLLFSSLVLPKKFPNPSELTVEDNHSISALLDMKSEGNDMKLLTTFMLSNKILCLNSFQSQVFDAVWNNFQSVLLCSNPNSGKFFISLLSILKFGFHDEERNFKVLILFPNDSELNRKLETITTLSQLLNCEIYRLQGQVAKDVKGFKDKNNYIIISTSENFDKFTKNPKKRSKQLSLLKVIVASNLEYLNLSDGGLYETCLIRLRFILSQMQINARFVATSVSIANYYCLSDFLGIEKEMSFNIHPTNLNNFINAHFYSFSTVDYMARFVTMIKHFYRILKINSFVNKSSIVYVDSLKSAKVLLSNLLKNMSKDEIEFESNKIESENNPINNLVEKTSDMYLKFFLEYQTGYLHSYQSDEEISNLKNLFENGNIKLLVVTREMIRSVDIDRKIDLAFIFDSEHLSNLDHINVLGKLNKIKYQNEVLQSVMDESFSNEKSKQFMNFLTSNNHNQKPTLSEIKKSVNRLEINEEQSKSLIDGYNCKLIIFSKASKKDYLKKNIFESVPLESKIHENLAEALNSEIVSSIISSKEECLDWLTWSFFYRRITSNPNYYNLGSRSSDEISEFLSEMIENCVDDLENNQCVLVEDEMNLSSDNLGVISSYYAIKISTIGTFANCVKQGLTWEKLISLFSGVSEFKKQSIEELFKMNSTILKELYPMIRYKMFGQKSQNDVNLNSIENSNNIVIQTVLSRTPLPKEFHRHFENMLSKYPSLIQSFIDTSNTWQILKPALLAMKFNQMLIQKIWFDDSSLLQLPYVTPEILSKWKKKDITNLDDFFDLEDEDRENLLKDFSQNQIEDIANVANRFPSVTIDAEFNDSKEEYGENEEVSMLVSIERDNWDDEDMEKDENGKILMPKIMTNNEFVNDKPEYWWLVVGDKGRNMLLFVKKIQFNEKTQKKVEFSLEKSGEYNLSVFLICDSYLGCDTEIQDLKLRVTSQIQEE